ncbi:MAG: hypothetical protein ACP5QA_14780 [Phycisphaerae bacterium]
MPTNRRYRSRRSRAVGIEDCRLFFEWDLDIAGAFSVCGGPVDMVRAREAWQRFRVEILAAWIQKHPGTRPYFWWLADAPEPRRQLCGAPPEDAPLFWGMPSLLAPPQLDDTPGFECQAAYLGRHGLLDDAERSALSRYVDEISPGCTLAQRMAEPVFVGPGFPGDASIDSVGHFPLAEHKAHTTRFLSGGSPVLAFITKLADNRYCFRGSRLSEFSHSGRPWPANRAG